MIDSNKVIHVLQTLFNHSLLEKQMKVSVNTVKTFHERVKVKLNIDNSLELRLLLKTRLDFFFISQTLNA